MLWQMLVAKVPEHGYISSISWWRWSSKSATSTGQPECKYSGCWTLICNSQVDREEFAWQWPSAQLYGPYGDRTSAYVFFLLSASFISNWIQTQRLKGFAIMLHSSMTSTVISLLRWNGFETPLSWVLKYINTLWLIDTYKNVIFASAFAGGVTSPRDQYYHLAWSQIMSMKS